MARHSGILSPKAVPGGSLTGGSLAGASQFGSDVTRFEPEAGANPMPGYTLLRLRGQGGFATVWEASTPTGERIALKFMSSANAASTAKELRSLQTIQNIQHPHLLKTRKVWSLAGNIVIAMDLADASLMDLAHLYADELGRPLEADKLGLYLHQTAQALDFLNARVHRIDGRLVALQHGDVKPNNILLLNDAALLADYGLATPVTTTMTPCHRQGTVDYCAPEVFQGHLSDKSDQFSFAVTYHVLRTHQFPFPPPPDDKEKLRGYVRPDPDLSALPPAERPVLLRALSPIPQARYRNCVELTTALLRAAGLQPVTDETGEVRIEPLTIHTPPPAQSFRL